mmetsp:Transcript_8034/g.30114  ORF Transcript_8034/g.30114 Transcript_8034/m.30114 type:complete len:277 (-) Transcript_8034:1323-2153(-)
MRLGFLRIGSVGRGHEQISRALRAFVIVRRALSGDVGRGRRAPQVPVDRPRKRDRQTRLFPEVCPLVKRAHSVPVPHDLDFPVDEEVHVLTPRVFPEDDLARLCPDWLHEKDQLHQRAVTEYLELRQSLQGRRCQRRHDTAQEVLGKLLDDFHAIVVRPARRLLRLERVDVLEMIPHAGRQRRGETRVRDEVIDRAHPLPDEVVPYVERSNRRGGGGDHVGIPRHADDHHDRLIDELRDRVDAHVSVAHGGERLDGPVHGDEVPIVDATEVDLVDL